MDFNLPGATHSANASGDWNYGPELVSVTLEDWAEQHNVQLEFIKPGRPMQNGFIERFNRSYRGAVLDMFVFQSLDEVREHLLTRKPEISGYP